MDDPFQIKQLSHRPRNISPNQGSEQVVLKRSPFRKSLKIPRFLKITILFSTACDHKVLLSESVSSVNNFKKLFQASHDILNFRLLLSNSLILF